MPFADQRIVISLGRASRALLIRERITIDWDLDWDPSLAALLLEEPSAGLEDWEADR